MQLTLIVHLCVWACPSNWWVHEQFENTRLKITVDWEPSISVDWNGIKEREHICVVQWNEFVWPFRHVINVYKEMSFCYLFRSTTNAIALARNFFYNFLVVRFITVYIDNETIFFIIVRRVNSWINTKRKQIYFVLSVFPLNKKTEAKKKPQNKWNRNKRKTDIEPKKKFEFILFFLWFWWLSNYMLLFSALNRWRWVHNSCLMHDFVRFLFLVSNRKTICLFNSTRINVDDFV